MRSHLYFVAAPVAAFVMGCSSAPKEQAQEKTPPAAPVVVQQPGSTPEPAKNRLVLDFQRQGLRLIHGASGEIEAIEVNGYAPVWAQSKTPFVKPCVWLNLRPKRA